MNRVPAAIAAMTLTVVSEPGAAQEAPATDHPPLPPLAAASNGEYAAELDGIRHWVRVAGVATGDPPLVIVHGGPGGHTYNFERTAGERLARARRLVYYEQRGSGRSAEPADTGAYSIPILVADLEQLRRALDVDRLDLLGYSFGGRLALEYALAHPDRVRRLVLQAPAIAPSPLAEAIQLTGFLTVASEAERQKIRAIMASGAPLDEQLARVWDTVSVTTVDRFLFHDPAAARRNRRMWVESGLVNTGRMARALQRQRADSVPLLERARAFGGETLVISGAWDRNVGVDVARNLAAAMPRARFAVFGGSAHFPDIEQEAVYARVVQEFLAASRPHGRPIEWF